MRPMLVSAGGADVHAGGEVQLVTQATARSDYPDPARLLQAVEASGEIIFMTDREGVFTFVNAQFERVYGYTAADVVGHATPRVLKSGVQSREFYGKFWQSLRRGDTFAGEFINRRKDGTTLSAAATVSSIRDEAGAIVGFLAIQRDITEHKRTEAALRESEARYRSLFDGMLNGVAHVLLIFDGDRAIDFVYLAVNPVFEKLTGLANVVGRRVTEIVPGIAERDRDVFERYGRVARTGVSEQFETWMAALNEWFFVSVYRHDVDQVVAVFDVITARKQAEAALRASQERLQLISDNVLDLVSQIRSDGTFLYVSPSYETVLGHTPAQLVGTSAFAFIHPDDVEHARAVFGETLKHLTAGRAELRYRHADGHYLWLDVVGKVLVGETGAPTAVLSGRDITASRRDAAALAESERRLSIAVSSAGMSVFTQDRDLRFTWIYNPQLGGTVEQVIGRTDLDLLPPEVAGPVVAIKRQAIEGAERVHGEFQMEVLGQKRVFELLVEPQKDGKGNVEGLRGALVDITRRRELEEQLRQSQKLEAVGSLAGGIAHDFNNMLTVILGYADLALSHLDAESSVREDIEEIQRAGQSATSLTRQLLIFSRKGIVKPELLHLNDIVAHVEKILRRVVGEDIRFTLRPGAGLGSVKADAGQIEQVLMNLAVNARDAMPSGGALTIDTDSVSVSDEVAHAHGAPAGGVFERVTVTDTGCGMSAEVQAKIFTPFFTTKAPDKGTGLGLATVHGIAQQAGGFIVVRSAPGEGASFSVHLPRAADGVVQRTSTTGAAGATLSGTETILFVEDNDGIRAFAARALEQYGYTVLTARHAGEALAVSAANPRISLLVTDLVLPGENGRVLAERLLASRHDLKVMYASGYTQDSIAVHDIQTAGLDFLQKPYTMEALLHAVRRVLDRP